MSTAHEVIAAKHCGIKVFGMSLITNKAIMEYDTTEEASHAEVLETSQKRQQDLVKFISELVRKLGEEQSSD